MQQSKNLLLEGYAQGYFKILQRLFTVRKTSGGEEKVHRTILQACAQPMEFISMDLVGEFHPPSSKGNRYAHTAVCMLTNFVFCIPLKNKSASEIITAWRNHIAFPFGVSRKILTDNGTEFKNSLFAEVAKELGLERKIYSPPYRPQSNGVLEGFHKFLKASFAKHISRHKEWDDVAAMAAASYNYYAKSTLKRSTVLCYVW